MVLERDLERVQDLFSDRFFLFKLFFCESRDLDLDLDKFLVNNFLFNFLGVSERFDFLSLDLEIDKFKDADRLLFFLVIDRDLDFCKGELFCISFSTTLRLILSECTPLLFLSFVDD